MGWFTSVMEGTWSTVLLSAPWLLIGLGMAGILHEFLPGRRVERWMGENDLGSILRAAAFGIPLPVCSCGVVPLAIELRRKGASRSASTAFLITTPESGADSIALTWGLLGPVMAVARPVASLITALATGLATAWTVRDDVDPVESRSKKNCCSKSDAAEGSASMASTRSLTARFVAALRYGYGTLLGDIAAWLVFGFILTGVITTFVPGDLSTLGLGRGWLPMLLLLAISVPLYICASASTPVAAALVAKGLSPGAALVFLLAGPATNAASLSVLTATFGRSWLRIYLGGIVLGSLASGWLLDAIIGWSGLTVISQLRLQSHEHESVLTFVWAAILIALLVGRMVGMARHRWVPSVGNA